MKTQTTTTTQNCNIDRKHEAVLITLADLRQEMRARKLGLGDMLEYSDREILDLISHFAKRASMLREIKNNAR